MVLNPPMVSPWVNFLLEMVFAILAALAIGVPVKWWFAGNIGGMVCLALLLLFFGGIIILCMQASKTVLQPLDPEHPPKDAWQMYIRLYVEMGAFAAFLTLFGYHAAWEFGPPAIRYDMIFIPAALVFWMFGFWAVLAVLGGAFDIIRTLFLIRCSSTKRWHVLARLLPLLFLMLTFHGINWLEQRALWRVVERSRPLPQAIERFITDRGLPPVSLTELVPGYLPEVPTPGLRVSPGYYYSRACEPGDELEICWYGLGSGRTPASGAWVFPRQDPAEAVLVLGVNKDGIIKDSVAEGIPDKVVLQPFDLASWTALPNLRQGMVIDLMKTKLYDLHLRELEALIGPARRGGLSRKWKWTLRVNVFLDWYLQYLHSPDQDVRTFGWGPILQAYYDDWGYIHYKGFM